MTYLSPYLQFLVPITVFQIQSLYFILAYVFPFSSASHRITEWLGILLKQGHLEQISHRAPKSLHMLMDPVWLFVHGLISKFMGNHGVVTVEWLVCSNLMSRRVPWTLEM